MILTDDHPPAPGGVATWTAAVAEGLRRAGDAVEVFARWRPDLPVGVHGVRGPSFGRHGGWWLRWAARRALHDADAVLATTWPVAAGLPAGLPLHVVFHGSDLTRPPVSARALRRVMERARHRWAVSRWLAERGAAEVLPAPVDPRPGPRRRPERPWRWGLLGRATPLKGGDRFVRLVAEAGVEGVVAGDGPELPRWRALAERLGARVRFLGHLPREALPAVLDGLDVALLLPRPAADGGGEEGLGLALLEAAASGVAVVGCRTGGVPEATGPGLLLEDPDDAPASVAKILAWWTPDRGEAQRAWLARHHGVDRTVARLRGARA